MTDGTTSTATLPMTAISVSGETPGALSAIGRHFRWSSPVRGGGRCLHQAHRSDVCAAGDEQCPGDKGVGAS